MKKYTLCLMSPRQVWVFGRQVYLIEVREELYTQNNQDAIAQAEQFLSAGHWSIDRKRRHVQLRHGWERPAGIVYLWPVLREQSNPSGISPYRKG